MNKSSRILNEIRLMFPNASCELNYNNLFELLIAVVLSAQTTDKRVNIVTSELFIKYPNPSSLGNASYEDVYEIAVYRSCCSSCYDTLVRSSR